MRASAGQTPPFGRPLIEEIPDGAAAAANTPLPGHLFSRLPVLRQATLLVSLGRPYAGRTLGELDLVRRGPGEARSFYVDALGLPVRFKDKIVVVVGDQSGRVVLHPQRPEPRREGHLPGWLRAGGAAVRFVVDDPDACEREALAQGLAVLRPAQEATRGRFVVLADPDGRSVVLARMRPVSA